MAARLNKVWHFESATVVKQPFVCRAVAGFHSDSQDGSHGGWRPACCLRSHERTRSTFKLPKRRQVVQEEGSRGDQEGNNRKRTFQLRPAGGFLRTPQTSPQMFRRPDGKMQRNRDCDNHRVYSLCPEARGMPALSHALLGSEARGERDPGAGGGASAVGHGDVDSDAGAVREAFSALSDRNDQHTAENHRRPLPRREKRKLQMHCQLCTVCTRFVRAFFCWCW